MTLDKRRVNDRLVTAALALNSHRDMLISSPEYQIPDSTVAVMDAALDTMRDAAGLLADDLFDGPGLTVSRGAMEDWAGRKLTDYQVDHLQSRFAFSPARVTLEAMLRQPDLGVGR